MDPEELDDSIREAYYSNNDYHMLYFERSHPVTTIIIKATSPVSIWGCSHTHHNGAPKTEMEMMLRATCGSISQ
jgi:TATA-box binding protein (TBP) (component of TFIID and TFIIIB)